VPKKKSNPYALTYPKTSNPLKEMSYCINKHIYVSCSIEGSKIGSQWEMGDRYCLTIRYGDDFRKTDYIYTKDNVVDAIYDTYREIYKMNHGKKTEE